VFQIYEIAYLIDKNDRLNQSWA